MGRIVVGHPGSVTLAAFSVLALLLAVPGLYGVLVRELTAALIHALQGLLTYL